MKTRYEIFGSGKRLPRLVVYHTADNTPWGGLGWNRYWGPPIGAYVTLARWCVSFQWRRPGPAPSDSQATPSCVEAHVCSDARRHRPPPKPAEQAVF